MDWLLCIMVGFVVVLSFFQSWNLSNGALRVVYPLAFVVSITNITIDVYIASVTPHQSGILLYCFPNAWSAFMAVRGMLRIRRSS